MSNMNIITASSTLSTEEANNIRSITTYHDQPNNVVSSGDNTLQINKLPDVKPSELKSIVQPPENISSEAKAIHEEFLPFLLNLTQEDAIHTTDLGGSSFQLNCGKVGTDSSFTSKTLEFADKIINTVPPGEDPSKYLKMSDMLEKHQLYGRKFMFTITNKAADDFIVAAAVVNVPPRDSENKDKELTIIEFLGTYDSEMEGFYNPHHHGRGRKFAPFLMLMCSLASNLWCGYETPSALYSENGPATLLYTAIGYKTIVDENVIKKLDSAYHYIQDGESVGESVGEYRILNGLQYKLEPLKLGCLDNAEDEDDDGSDSDDDLSFGSNNNDNSKQVETRRSSLRSSSRNGSGSGSSGISDSSDNSNGNGSSSANTKDNNDKSGVNNDKKLPTGVYKTKAGNWCVMIRYQGSNRQIGTWPTLEQATKARNIAWGMLKKKKRDDQRLTDEEIKRNVQLAKEAAQRLGISHVVYLKETAQRLGISHEVLNKVVLHKKSGLPSGVNLKTEVVDTHGQVDENKSTYKLNHPKKSGFFPRNTYICTITGKANAIKAVAIMNRIVEEEVGEATEPTNWDNEKIEEVKRKIKEALMKENIIPKKYNGTHFDQVNQNWQAKVQYGTLSITRKCDNEDHAARLHDLLILHHPKLNQTHRNKLNFTSSEAYAAKYKNEKELTKIALDLLLSNKVITFSGLHQNMMEGTDNVLNEDTSGDEDEDTVAPPPPAVAQQAAAAAVPQLPPQAPPTKSIEDQLKVINEKIIAKKNEINTIMQKMGKAHHSMNEKDVDKYTEQHNKLKEEGAQYEVDKQRLLYVLHQQQQQDETIQQGLQQHEQQQQQQEEEDVKQQEETVQKLAV